MQNQSMMPAAAPWLCDNCGRANGVTRYQCQQCRGYNTYDLCDQCILRASTIHPHHSFRLVQQAPVATTNWYTPTYGQRPSTTYQQPSYYSYVGQRQPTWKITYEYKG